jgi:electron transfer flavoprotein beta subunit
VKICVLVKAVPDASRRVVPETGLLDRSGEGGLNTGDRYAIEAALQLRAGGGVSEIVAVTMGPANAGRAIRRALAMGCDRAVHLCDDALAGSDLAATGRALAAVLRREEPWLVLLGERTSDGGGGVMAAVVAEHLGLPVIAAARSLIAVGERLVAEQITEFGRLTVALASRAVIAIATDANTPRYASLKETMQVSERQIDMLSCVDVGIDRGSVGRAGAAVDCGSWHVPEPRAAGRIVEPASVDAAVDAVLVWLRETGLA